jgi:hypothetical protein
MTWKSNHHIFHLYNKNFSPWQKSVTSNKLHQLESKTGEFWEIRVIVRYQRSEFFPPYFKNFRLTLCAEVIYWNWREYDTLMQKCKKLNLWSTAVNFMQYLTVGTKLLWMLQWEASVFCIMTVPGSRSRDRKWLLIQLLGRGSALLDLGIVGLF